MREAVPIPDLRDDIRETLQEHQRGNQATMAQHYEAFVGRLNGMGKAITAAAEVSAAKVDCLREALEARMQDMEMKSVLRDQTRGLMNKKNGAD